MSISLLKNKMKIMALNDCTECWVTPCVCGNDYQDWTIEKLKKQIKMLEVVLNNKCREVMTPEEFVKKQEEILKKYKIPKDLQIPCQSLAWQLGHSYGYENVLIHLEDICETFSEPFAKMRRNNG
jgi:hypothetical protein